MTRWQTLFVAMGLAIAAAMNVRASGAVLVLANQTDDLVQFIIAPKFGNPRGYQIVAGDVLPIPVEEEVGIRFETGRDPAHHVLDPGAVYYFFRKDQLDLVRRGFLPDEARGAAALPASVDPARRDAIGEIPVMVLVDDEEPAVQRVWEARLRQRFAEASDIFEHHCRIRFKVVAVGTWDSDDGVIDLELGLREFERKVLRPPGARLVVGFTSQYEKPQGRTHLGGTRGPLHSHILIREWSQHISYTERLEVLAHELGHILGAVHSPDQNSVMRPLVGDRRSRAKSFRIGFDPVNTLVLYTFGEQIRLHGAWQLSRFSPEARTLLEHVYAEAAKEMPEDGSAEKYLTLVRRAEDATLGDQQPLVVGARRVIRAVADAAGRNHAQADPAGAAPHESVRLEGDRLTELYVRAAATAADELPDEVAPQAFLLGLSVALDDSAALRANPTLGRVFRRLETPQDRKQRVAVLGTPTVHGRRDLAQHFFVSSAITVLAGQFAAESTAVLKEMSDARGGAGFSFADLAADVAGAAFATQVGKNKVALATLARGFAVGDFVPPPDDLPEGLSEKAFSQTYGSPVDPRFRAEQDALRRRVLALPGFSPRTAKKD